LSVERSRWAAGWRDGSFETVVPGRTDVATVRRKLFRLLNFSSRGTDEAGSTRLAIVHTLCRVVACVANDAAAFLVEITGVARAIVASGTVRYFDSTLSAVSSVLALQVDVAFGVWTVEASWANNRILRLVRTVRALGTGLGRGGAGWTEGPLSTGDGVRACPWAVASCGAVETRALSRLGELWLVSAFGTLGSNDIPSIWDSSDLVGTASHRDRKYLSDRRGSLAGNRCSSKWKWACRLSSRRTRRSHKHRNQRYRLHRRSTCSCR